MAGAVLAFSFRRRLISALRDKTRLNRLFGMTRWIIVFFHRIFRLIPAYVMVLGGTSTIFNKIGNGPLWNQKDGVFGSKCETKDWWKHLLFIINYFPTECMPWMWYISLDMQFYLLAPICLYFLHGFPSFGKSFIIFVILASSIYRFIIYAVYEFPSNIILRMIEKESVINEEAAH
uniref:Acyltransferase 3 domain-containing protein n=1 Tax=Panagrolaimus sp. JU765 TaxID=591449 RepID=A0AC34R8Q9_9BILA